MISSGWERIKTENFAELGKKLGSGPMGDKLRMAAQSPEGQKIMSSVNTARLEKAAKSGDVETLRDILGKVLATEEGRALAEKIKQSVEGR